ncbi:DNA-binding death effector domain-containing protein 2 isoform X2 [Trichechus manatus latirostris]|uniref:DNA-binding death effector domain-containing protein 2 n=1 Tax=Trichechus manatus latirostris TaxID=127582 RepID=A0A2Y9RY69_TRIMA|nr:DNA-binding death effector domain-containing protein 2 isoform X2 [Trichechus manatus latirostris]
MALPGPTPAPGWEEDECLDYYGMLSLHRMFEVVGGQLTECELELLAFLLDEAPGAAGGLARARSGLELLLELERRGQCDESDLRLLRQLLRVLARHDLLPHLARKRRRPVSPERYSCGTSSSSKRAEGSCCRRRHQSNSSSHSQQGQWETGSPPTKRQRRSRGRPSGGARRRRRGAPAAPQQQQEPARPTSEGKVTCAFSSGKYPEALYNQPPCPHHHASINCQLRADLVSLAVFWNHYFGVNFRRPLISSVDCHYVLLTHKNSWKKTKQPVSHQKK